MQVRHLKASSVVVESGDTRVLCDPWLLDGAFYGAWSHYPPLSFEPEEYDDVDYIYVSHIHPDHFHRPTMERLDTDVPVLVHDYQTDFLKANIERLGFEAIELPHDERTHLGDDLHINVLGADDCDPEACGNYFGCGWWMESAGERTSDGSTQIDSMGVFDDGDSVVVNANDCRWPLSLGATQRVKDQYEDIDLLLMQYGAANFYPQCMGDYSPAEKEAAAREVSEEMLGDASGFIETLEPDHFMPFAGSYVISGDLADRNEYLAVPRRIDAANHLADLDAVPDDSEPVLLNSEEAVDAATGEQTAPYTPVNPAKKRRYIEEELAERTFEHQQEELPPLSAFEDPLREAYEHFEDKRVDIGWESDTEILLDLVEDTVASVSADGGGVEIVPESDLSMEPPYVRMRMDPRLLHRILRGPQYAHFNNAQIGSHISFEKEPDVYERPLYYAMSFFHA